MFFFLVFFFPKNYEKKYQIKKKKKKKKIYIYIYIFFFIVIIFHNITYFYYLKKCNIDDHKGLPKIKKNGKWKKNKKTFEW